MTPIDLPVNDRPSRIHRTAPAPAPIPVDDVAQTLAEYTRLALSTGARLRIDPPEFTADGEVWVPLWLHDEPPAGARVTVWRDDVDTTIVRRWKEALPGETALTPDGRRWLDIWLDNPTERFESYVVRAALARAYPDVILDRPEPGKPLRPSTVVAPATTDPEQAPLTPSALQHLAESEPFVNSLLGQWGSNEHRPRVVPRPPAADVPHLTPTSRRSRGGRRR